jgi:hypothetical protein
MYYFATRALALIKGLLAEPSLPKDHDNVSQFGMKK